MQKRALGWRQLTTGTRVPLLHEQRRSLIARERKGDRMNPCTAEELIAGRRALYARKADVNELMLTLINVIAEVSGLDDRPFVHTEEPCGTLLDRLGKFGEKFTAKILAGQKRTNFELVVEFLGTDGTVRVWTSGGKPQSFSEAETNALWEFKDEIVASVCNRMWRTQDRLAKIASYVTEQ